MSPEALSSEATTTIAQLGQLDGWRRDDEGNHFIRLNKLPDQEQRKALQEQGAIFTEHFAFVPPDHALTANISEGITARVERIIAECTPTEDDKKAVEYARRHTPSALRKSGDMYYKGQRVEHEPERLATIAKAREIAHQAGFENPVDFAAATYQWTWDDYTSLTGDDRDTKIAVQRALQEMYPYTISSDDLTGKEFQAGGPLARAVSEHRMARDELAEAREKPIREAKAAEEKERKEAERERILAAGREAAGVDTNEALMAHFATLPGWNKDGCISIRGEQELAVWDAVQILHPEQVSVTSILGAGNTVQRVHVEARGGLREAVQKHVEEHPEMHKYTKAVGDRGFRLIEL